MARLILLTDFSEAYAFNLLKGILDYAKENSPWTICRMPYAYKQKYGIKGVIKWAKKWKADAIVAQFDNEDPVELFKENGIVAVAQDFKSRFSSIPNITSNYLLAGKMAAEYFLAKGFQHFAFYGYKDVVWSKERCLGYKSEVIQKGYGNSFYEYCEQELEDLWFYEPTSLVSWLTSLPYPIALMACDDNQGNKIAEICKVNGIKIPEEIAVLGVDNDKTICSISDPPLSSINMTVDRGGYEVAKLIDTLIKEKRYQGDDIIIYSTDIVSRASTNIYATQDHHIALSLKYIHENYNKKIAVKDILNLVPLSRRLLELHFKEVTKQSIYQYILNLRMNLFAQYLLESDEPVSNIADLIGLRNDTNVARQFKILKGCTPSEYRRLYATQQYR